MTGVSQYVSSETAQRILTLLADDRDLTTSQVLMLLRERTGLFDIPNGDSSERGSGSVSQDLPEFGE
jgi:hypothetical protein